MGNQERTNQPPSDNRWITVLAAGLALLSLAVGLLLFRLRRLNKGDDDLLTYPSPDLEGFSGLSDEEAESRLSRDIEEDRKKAARRV